MVACTLRTWSLIASDWLPVCCSRLRHLARIVESRSFPKGTVISQQGVPADMILFLKSGSVTLKKEVEETVHSRWPSGPRAWEVTKVHCRLSSSSHTWQA